MTSQHLNSAKEWRETCRPAQRADEGIAAWRIVSVVARLALAAAFLSAVADRTGLWGAPGTNVVAWGNFDAFVAYTGRLSPYLSGWALQGVAVAATVAELFLGLTLLLGVALRWSAWLSTALLLVFGLSMAVFVNPEFPLNFSVFSAMAASAMLAMAPRNALIFTLDRKLPQRLERLNTRRFGTSRPSESGAGGPNPE